RQIPPAEWKRLFDSRLGRASGVWSKKEVVLPEVEEKNIVSLGEGNSPLIKSERLAKHLGIDQIHIKQCGTSHTGSFKDLGMTVLVSSVNQIRSRIRAVACASTGDTSAALSAYCAAAGIPAIVFLPKDKVSVAQLIQPVANDAITISIDTDFDGCMRIVQEITKDGSIYLANSMNSLRVEGQKTISFEIVQQLDWQVPDFVIVPGGNLGNVSAIGNGFLLMREMGIIDRLARIARAQADRFGFFTDPQTGVALAATIKLVKANVISPSSRVIVISTAHGLKFAEFKTKLHQGQLPEADPTLQNNLIQVPPDVAAVRAAIN